MSPAKRALDFMGASAGLVILSPALLAIALLIKLNDGGPAFFRQIRVGRGGRPFTIVKFRTMRVEADRGRGSLTVGADARITRLGRWLRRLKLDELPQLWNVVSGEMSLVGPRPEVPAFVELYTPGQRRVLELVPGMTDPASIHFVDESELLGTAPDPERLYADVLVPEKIRMNLEYAERASVRSDLEQIARTFMRILRR